MHNEAKGGKEEYTRHSSEWPTETRSFFQSNGDIWQARLNTQFSLVVEATTAYSSNQWGPFSALEAPDGPYILDGVAYLELDVHGIVPAGQRNPKWG